MMQFSGICYNKNRTIFYFKEDNYMSQTDVYQLVTNRIIELLEAGVVPWQQPWTGTGNAAYSRVTGKHYSFLNQLLLNKPGEWLTFKQIEKLGGHVNQGEESKVVVFWKMLRITETDDAGEEREKTIPFLAHYHVFHIDQTTGITPLTQEEQNAILQPNEIAENVICDYIENGGPELEICYSEDALYNFEKDSITVPRQEQYLNKNEYYSTLFHELVHSTGYKDRLNRIKKGHSRNSDAYAKEELVAEIGASALCNICNIDNRATLNNSAAYINSWLSTLRGDKKLIVHASGQAQKAVQYILNAGKDEA